ncbi:hypothetical protein [Cesiribacter sp. SM1]|uniref:hypothetical protein n=1 Tax=Cesiribacter sp. SM1 TaxID=2861196 RepID=UPI001CD6F0E9|nr:hypothetical protein [Cesiribacter sp. SM1]
MKEPTTYEMNEESRDLLLFDYLEGNLTEERAAMLKKALSTDHQLQAELELWKDSFVVQEFYATDVLEDKLLRKVKKPFPVTGPAAGFLLLLVASLLSFIPAGEDEHVTYFIKRPLPESPLTEAAPADEKALEAEVNAGAPAIPSNLALQRPAEQQIVVVAPPVAVSDRLAALPHTLGGMPETKDSFLKTAVPAVMESRESPARLHPTKEYSRKKERQIRRMKEKALQQKKANEFIKGNRPYVVPLDTQNF